MSKQTGVTSTTGEPTSSEGGGASDFKAITSQAEFDAAIQSRLAREQAKFTDYDELKAAAGKLKELEDAQKSESQRQAEALEKAQRELADLTVAKTRAEVAAAKGVPVALLNGSTQEELEASADALIEFKSAQDGSQRKVPNTWDRPSTNVSVADQFADWSASTFS